MINIVDKKNCCGCSACVQRCPKQCISLVEDNEGFLYPVVDNKICIIANHIEDTWSIQRKYIDMDYLALFFMFNHTYSQILCDERKIKNDSGVWMDIKDYIWIRKIAG